MESVKIGLDFEVVTGATPSVPGAKRGAVYDGVVCETWDQLEAGLVWLPCLFCGRRVLIDSNVRGREKCSCGAIRCHSRGSEGWRKDGDEFWFI